MGNNSRVLKAVDKHTGITVALKVYNKHKLSDMEKCALSFCNLNVKGRKQLVL
jgi:hypothetical protein